jgi:DNA-binding NarL/FixJ family response regulator
MYAEATSCQICSTMAILERRKSMRSSHAPTSGRRDATTRVLVVDERAAVRAGARAVLSGEPGLELETAGSVGAAVKQAASGSLDLCLVDYNLARGGTGMFVACRLKQLSQAPRVVLYAEYVDGYLAGAAKVAGADGLVCQHADADELAQVLRRAARGERQFSAIPPSAMYELCKRIHAADRPIVTMAAHDTRREHISEVMGLSDEWLTTRTWAILEQLHAQLASPTPAAALAASA